MTTHRSLDAPAAVDALILRVGRLTPASVRQWGTMTPHEMLCHLADSFAAVLGEREVSSAETWMARNVLRRIALHTSLRWPQGVPTRPEVDAKLGGTKPLEFDRDRGVVVEHVRRFPSPDTRYGRHPAFGPLTREEWLVWGYRHVDHHLRQFGV
ncbi:MAG: DUF1569 domain-containing protein [Acidobacteria bacterium]|nr:DUF1569 domain-containing protein [Acidobacteriota bacterium]